MAYWLQGVRLRPEARPLPHLPSADIRHLDTARARLRIALISTLGVVAALAFVVFPPRQLSVNADGQVITVVSRQKDIGTLLDSAGVKRDPGDVFVVSAGGISVERAIPVVVEVDGVALSWRTRATNVGSLLNDLRVDVSPYDTITYNGLEVTRADAVYPQPLSLSSLASYGIYNQAAGDVQGIILNVQRAVPVTVVEDGRAVPMQTSGASVGEVLTRAGISLGPADELYPPADAPVTSGMQLTVRHAKAINLRLGQSTSIIYSQKETLKDALAEAGFNFGPDDRVEPALDVAVTNGMYARLVRVTGQSYFEREPVKHKTVFKADDSLQGTDTRRIEGKDGSLATEYKIVIEDGVEKEKTLVGQKFDPEPVDTVIYYSASAVNSTGSTANLQVRETKRMYATWYNAASSGRPATDPHYGITASGVPVTKGIVAVDKSLIPLGTRMYVPGYGFAVAGDTGGGVTGDMLDLGFPDGVAVDWRTGWVDVYILSP